LLAFSATVFSWTEPARKKADPSSLCLRPRFLRQLFKMIPSLPDRGPFDSRRRLFHVMYTLLLGVLPVYTTKYDAIESIHIEHRRSWFKVSGLQGGNRNQSTTTTETDVISICMHFVVKPRPNSTNDIHFLTAQARYREKLRYIRVDPEFRNITPATERFIIQKVA
jgi:hypothetical protein